MRNRQFVFSPKIEYKLVAERSEANQNPLTFPVWRSILELVRTHFSGKFPPRKLGKAAPARRSLGAGGEPYRSKPQKNPEKNIGSNHILIFGEENFLIINSKHMNQKNIVLMFVLVVALGAITYFFISKNSSAPATLPTSINPSSQQSVAPTGNNPVAPTAPQSLNGKKLLSVNFPLKSGHKLYMEYDASIVPMGKLFDLEVSSENITQVKSVDELSRITGQISTKEQALAFVKFFTSELTGFLLKPNPISGIEPSDERKQGGQMPNSLTRLMTTANIELRDGQWVIERDLLMYPNWANQKQQTPAQLVRSHEIISQAGTYTFGIGKVLAEGDEINRFLLYYE